MANSGGNDGQLWFSDRNSDTNLAPTILVDTTPSGTATTKAIETGDVTANPGVRAIELDTANNLYFTVENVAGSGGSVTPTLFAKRIDTNAVVGSQVIANISNNDYYGAIAVDVVRHVIYISVFGGTKTTAPDNYDEIIRLRYNPAAGNGTSATAAGTAGAYPYDATTKSQANDNNTLISNKTDQSFTVPDSMAVDTATDELFSAVGDDTSYSNFPQLNAIYVNNNSSTTIGAASQSQITSPTQFSNSTDQIIRSIAIDPVNRLIYFLTSTRQKSDSKVAYLYYISMDARGGQATPLFSTDNGILPYTIAGSLGTSGSTLSFDPTSHALYVVNDNPLSPQSSSVDGRIYQIPLSTDGKAIGTPSLYATDTGASVDNLAFDALPVLNASSANAVAQQNGSAAVTVLASGTTVADPDSYVRSATASLGSTYKNGDVLSLSGTSNGTYGYDNQIFTVSYNAGTLTITSPVDPANGVTATAADYAYLLSAVQYKDGYTDTSSGAHPTRSVTFQVNDGAANNPSGVNSSVATVTINRPPNAMTSVTANVVEGASAPASGTSSLGDVDPDGDTVTVTSVTGSKASSTVPNGGSATVAGTYGMLTVTSGDASSYAASDRTAIDAATSGSHPVDTFTYTASDGKGGNTTQTRNFSIDRPAAVGGAAPTDSYTENNAAITVDGTITVSDPDGDGITGATVKIGSGFISGTDSLVFLNTTKISGSYNTANGVLTLSGSDTESNYQAALQSVKFQASGDNPDNYGTDTSRMITFQVSGSGGSSSTKTDTVNVVAVNDPPAVTTGNTAAFTEKGGAVKVSPAGSVTDSDSANFNGGSLTVAITANSTAADQLTIVDQGNAGGQIGVSGSTVSYGGAAIGTFTSGTNGSSLVVTFNTTSATPAAAAALLKDITFNNTSNVPSTATRTVTTTVVDGDGTANGGSGTGTATSTVTVAAVDDAPSFSGLDNRPTATKAAAVPLDGNAAISDPELDAANNYGGASLTLARDGGANAQDVFGSGTGTYAAAGDVVVDGVTVGTKTNANGQLKITFNGNATTALVNEVLDQITYSNTGTTNGSVQIDYTINDGNTGAQGPGPAKTGTGSITVTVVADYPPVIAGLDGDSATYTEGATLVRLDAGTAATVSDQDSTDFNGGNLTVHVGTGAVAGEDVLGFDTSAATGVTVSGNAVSVGGQQVGTFAGGTGGQDLVVTFTTTDATPATVTKLVDALTYSDSSAQNPTGGTRSVSVTVNDGDGGTSTAANVSVTVVPVNDAPMGANKTVTTLEDTAYTFTAGDFGFTDPNDTPANMLLAVKVDTLPGAGTLTDNGVAVAAGQSVSAADVTGGLLKFTPAANANGTNYAAFTFQVQDNGGTANGGQDTDPTPKTLTVDVTPVNDAPMGANKTVTTLEDTAYTFTAGDFGFTDPNDTPANMLLAVKVDTLPGAGTLTDNGVAVAAGQSVSAADVTGGLLKFTPAANANGTNYAAFTFQVQDNGGTANGGQDTDPTPKTLTVNVTPVNDAPMGANKTVTTLEDTAYTFTAGDFGFTDPNDTPANMLLAVKVDTLPGAGTLTDNGVAVAAGQSVSAADVTGGLLKFTPAANANGTNYAAFTFQVQDNGGTANGGQDTDPTPKTLTVDVTPVNDAPMGANKTVTTLEDTAYTFTAGDFGFTDPNDTPANMLLAVKVDTLPGAGTLTDNGVAVAAGQSVSAADVTGGLLKFTPAANANGTNYAAFTFQVQDNGGTANGGQDTDPTPKTLTVDVTPVNDAPMGANKTVTTLEDTAYTFTAGDFGFTDPNDTPANMLLAVKVDTLPGAGTLTDNGVAVAAGQSVSAADVTGGLLKFTPAANANGTNYAAFTFQVQDNGGTANGGQDTDPTPKTLTVNVTPVNDAPALANATSTASYVEAGTPVVLNANLSVSDAELTASNDFGGASLTLVRDGGANAADLFGGSGALSLTGGNAIVSGTTIGTYTNTNGTFVLTFNTAATNADVNTALESLTYATSGHALPASVKVDATFSDGNTGAQGTGGALTAAGNTVVSVTVATPSKPVLDAGSDTGRSQSDGVTNKNSGLVFTGTAEADTLVTIYDGGTAIGSATAGDNGAYAVTEAGTLSDGAHDISATATNGGQVMSLGSAATRIVVDAFPPATVVTGIAAATDSGTVGDGLTNLARPVITGTAEAGASVEVFDGTTDLGGTTAAGDGSWTFQPASAFADGAHAINAKASDLAGNAVASSTGFALTIDTVPPAVSSPSLTVAQNGAATPIGIAAPTDAGSLAVVAGALPSDGTVALAGGAAVAAGQALSISDLTGLTFTPTRGAYNASSAFTYSVTDGAGNSSTGTATLAVGGPGLPTIAGTVAGQNTAREIAVRPFASAVVSDPSTATDTLTIALSGRGGVLLDGPGRSGLTRTGANTYSLAAGTADAVTAELQALVFVPTFGGSNTRTTTGFALIDTSSAGTTSRTDTATTVINTDRRTGRCVDGYLAGTTVFEDDNNNGVLDPGEASAVTASDGSFDLPYSLSPLVAIGGTDTSTGVANTATLAAPSGATAVSPLTTLVSAVAAQNGGDVAAAQAAVQSAFGLPADTDLLSLDPVAAAASGTAAGSAAYVASAQAQDTVALLAAAGSATGYAAIAAAITRSPDKVDLEDSATLASIGSAAGLSGSTLGRTVALAQASNAALATAAGATASPDELLAAVATAQRIAQGTVASALATAVSTGDTSALKQIVSTYAPGNFTGELAFDPYVSYGAGVFTLTGTTQLLNATGIEVFATVDGTRADLGAATLNGDGTFTFKDAIGAHTQGFITAIETDADGSKTTGTINYSLQGGLGGAGRAGQQVRYSEDGSALTGSTTFRPNGSRNVDIASTGQTLHSSFFDTFANHGVPLTTFVFDPGHGLDLITLFRANGSDHDTLNLPASDFTSFAAVLENTHNVKGGVQILDPVSGDTIKLAGVSKKELFANQQDFAFHS